MNRTETHPEARGLGRRLRIDRHEQGVAWSNPATGTRCDLGPNGVYEVSRANADATRTPVILGTLPSTTAHDYMATPRSRRARTAAATVIAVVDAMNRGM